MTRRQQRRTILPRLLLALLALVVLRVPAARAQEPDGENAAGASTAVAPQGAPKVVVLPFEFAAATPPVPPRRRGRYVPPPPIFGPGLGRGPGVLPAPVKGGGAASAAAAESRMRAPDPRRDDPYFRDDLTNGIGAGVADLLVERLVEAGGFRVLERQRLDAVLAERALDSTSRAAAGGGAATVPLRAPAVGADYLITGSVVRFGVEEKHALGGLGRITGLGVLGLKRPTTKVMLVARVIDAASGEVVLALRGEGVSRKGTGLTLGGIARGAGGVISVGSSSFRESALGEATLRAVDTLATRLAERRGALRAR